MPHSTQTPNAGPAGSVPTAAVGYPLDLSQIQGQYAGRVRQELSSFLFLSFADKQSARDWVGSIAGEVATAHEIAKFDGLFKLVNSRRGRELGVLKATWMNIAFTHKGMAFLGASEADKFSAEIKQGMKGRAAANNDTGTTIRRSG